MMTSEDYVLVEQLPSPADYNRLRQAVGWGVYQEAVIEQALPNTLYCVCVLLDGEIIGMARIIDDDGMVYYIQDVIVIPACQRQGVGARMLDSLMAYVQAHAHQNTIVGLMAAHGKEPFYEKYGFTRRPTDRLGAGMTCFWQK